MTHTIYREEGRTKCPACQRSVAAVREIFKTKHPELGVLFGQGLPMVSRHLYQEQVQLNEVGAPIEYTDGFCPGSFEPAGEVVRK